MTIATVDAAAQDFDFLFGSWQIANERLTSRLTGSDGWERFEAVGSCQPILGGIANFDDFRPARPGHEGFEGASLRLFNPATGLWSIYWADNAGCTLLPPVVGGFHGGVGEFFGDDLEGSLPLRVRFRWTVNGPDSLRWEQAFSADHGETWETNWIMTFRRIQDGACSVQEACR